MTPEQIQRMHELSWYHSIELAPGIITPGLWAPANYHVKETMDRVPFKDKRVLDIGTLNGLWAFEAWQRGADVTVIDTPEAAKVAGASFAFAQSILGAQAVKYMEYSVFDLPCLDVGRDFDIILFFGVYYHVADPCLAFRKITKTLAKGGYVLVEGAAAPGNGVWASFNSQTVIYAKDKTTYWVPTGQCLLDWMKYAGLEIVEHWPVAYGERYHVVGRKPC